MLAIRIENDRQNFCHQHASGELLIGRRPDEREPHIRVEDEFVSRRHLLLQQLTPSTIRLQNIGRNAVELPDGQCITQDGVTELDLPTSVRVGQTVVHFCADQIFAREVSEETEVDSDLYATITEPIPRGPGASARAPLATLGETPTAAELALWFETLLSVQRSAFGSSGFYQETAQAIVDLIGLDRGLVLLRSGDKWKVRATWSRRQTATSEYSRSVLKQVVAKQRTFFGNPQESISLGASLRTLAAVVGSPIFDSQGEVVGMLYGSKDSQPGAKQLKITELEAQLVQLLASSISSGLHRQQMEEQLRQSQQLAAVGQAMGYIIHDLRGPLGNIEQLVEMLRQDQEQGFTREEQLEFVKEAVGISLELLNDTLEFCRGQVQVQPRRGPFHQLFEKHLRLLRMTLQEYGIGLQIDVPPETEIVVDADRMARVLRNLAKNAAEALSGQSDVTVTIGTRAKDDGVELWVADDGPGLPDEVRTRIFQPFASHGKKGGTGFGLAIAKQLVEAHGGTIDVDSSSGGTRFTIRLPARDVAAEPAAEPSQVERETSVIDRPKTSLSILLAEDSLVNQRLTKALLSAQGHQITVVSDGQQAVEAVQEGAFDAILMDIEMPTMNGLDACRAIRQREGGDQRHIPMLALSAHDNSEMRQQCTEAGMDRFLTKPVRPDDLQQALYDLFISLT